MTNALNEWLRTESDAKKKRAAIRLEEYGFMFGTHFGTDNSVSRLGDVKNAIRAGRLYEYLTETFGMQISGVELEDEDDD